MRSRTFTFPAPAGGGSFKVFANSVNGKHIVDAGAGSSFTILPSKNEPTIHTSTDFVSPGGTFTATGNAFKPGEKAQFTLFGVVVAMATVGPTGNIQQTTIPVPGSAAFGPTSLTVTGLSSHKTTRATIRISNDWTQYGYNSAKGANEPHDPVIAHTITVGPNTILSLSWLYPTGAAVNTLPAILNGVAYVGNKPARIINGTVFVGGDGGLNAFSPNGAAPMDETRGAIGTIADQNSWTCSVQP